MYFQLFDHMLHFISQSILYTGIYMIKIEFAQNIPIPNLYISQSPIRRQKPQELF